MPIGIYIYEIDESFGPKLLAEYNVSKEKATTETLKALTEKHLNNLSEVTLKGKGVKFYSCVLKSEKIEKNIHLGFTLREDESLLSLKSIFKKIESIISNNYDAKDKRKLQELLKNTLTSIMSFMEKLKEPKIIRDQINEKTKKMLDNGKYDEASQLMKLGEEVPPKLASEVKMAEQLLRQKLYKKAKKSYLSAAKLAGEIQEDEMVSFLEIKAEHVGNIPDLMKEREGFLKEVHGLAEELGDNQLTLYPKMVKPLEQIITITSSFEDDVLIQQLTEIKDMANKATEIAKELYRLDKNLRELIDKI